MGTTPAMFLPRNGDQWLAAETVRRCAITFLLGGRGTGKTHCAVGTAAGLVQAKKANRIVLIRPTVEAGRSLGFLPGELDQKLDPWLGGFKDCVSVLADRVDTFFEQYVTAEPLGYLRGRTFKKAVIILDEAQNCSVDELDMVIGRLGEGSKLVIVGDPAQTDTREPSHLAAVAAALNGLTVEAGNTVYSVGSVTLTAQCRHPLLDAAAAAIQSLRLAHARGI